MDFLISSWLSEQSFSREMSQGMHPMMIWTSGAEEVNNEQGPEFRASLQARQCAAESFESGNLIIQVILLLKGKLS
jgi:hypothetical protein